MKKPLILMILDGWGQREEKSDNAIALARTPNYDAILQKYPHTLIDASGKAVGLPAGIMGNSEVGHLTMGAGRIAQVGLTRIYSAIEDGSFFENPALKQACEFAKENQSTLHLMGLVSDGAVHSHQDHLYALLEMAKREEVRDVAIHVFTDGRDTPPQSAQTFVEAIENKIKEIGIGKIASIMGRFYAMDRDQRWERTQKAYNALVLGEGHPVRSAQEAIEQAYARGENDEFITPCIIEDTAHNPIGKIKDGDAILFFNFRADRARQLTRAFTSEDFSAFHRIAFPSLSTFVAMSEYSPEFAVPVAFPRVHLSHTLGEILAQHRLRQLRIAETEKYAHVTFFFNGGEERVFEGEERILIPSPREVATYDLKPEMSAPTITQRLIKELHRDIFDVVILNFANADMVGHSGKLDAAIQAVEVLDAQIGKIQNAVLQAQGTLIITADHGNCEKMKDEQQHPHTAHTTDLVPFIVVGETYPKQSLRSGGTLADIAPTILQILKIAQPTEMTGKNLLIPV